MNKTKELTNGRERAPYEAGCKAYAAPRAEAFRLAAQSLSLLTSFSAEAGFEDWLIDEEEL